MREIIKKNDDLFVRAKDLLPDDHDQNNGKITIIERKNKKITLTNSNGTYTVGENRLVMLYNGRFERKSEVNEVARYFDHLKKNPPPEL